MLHYLPGCDVRKNHPQAISKITNYMSNKDIIIDACCRTKKKFLNTGDVIVNNCTLCEMILKETHNNNEIISLYEYILNDVSFPWQNHHGEVITLQDCWRTKDNLRLQNAIRSVLKKMNYTIVEMEENHEHTNFCGIWLNNLPAQNCVAVAPKTFNNIIENDVVLLSLEEQTQRMEDWVSKYTTDQVLVYCNGCEKGIKLGGGSPINIVEIIAENL